MTQSPREGPSPPRAACLALNRPCSQECPSAVPVPRDGARLVPLPPVPSVPARSRLRPGPAAPQGPFKRARAVPRSSRETLAALARPARARSRPAALPPDYAPQDASRARAGRGGGQWRGAPLPAPPGSDVKGPPM